MVTHYGYTYLHLVVVVFVDDVVDIDVHDYD